MESFRAFRVFRGFIPLPQGVPVKLTIESTPTVSTIAGCPCRLWEGVTAQGVRLWFWVRMISTSADDDDDDKAALDPELVEVLAGHNFFTLPLDTLHEWKQERE
jgi:hypothetical protein